MPGVKDKVVVITGASSGIGDAAAVMLAEGGAKVVLGARGLDRLQSLARRIERAGGEVAYAQTDVRKREDVTSLVNLACERYGHLDVLINIDPSGETSARASNRAITEIDGGA